MILTATDRNQKISSLICEIEKTYPQISSYQEEFGSFPPVDGFLSLKKEIKDYIDDTKSSFKEIKYKDMDLDYKLLSKLEIDFVIIKEKLIQKRPFLSDDYDNSLKILNSIKDILYKLNLFLIGESEPIIFGPIKIFEGKSINIGNTMINSDSYARIRSIFTDDMIKGYKKNNDKKSIENCDWKKKDFHTRFGVAIRMVYSIIKYNNNNSKSEEISFNINNISDFYKIYSNKFHFKNIGEASLESEGNMKTYISYTRNFLEWLNEYESLGEVLYIPKRNRWQKKINKKNIYVLIYKG